MPSNRQQRPEWVPENAGPEFATRVMPGVHAPAREAPRMRPAQGEPAPEELFARLRSGSRAALAQAITLVESTAERHDRAARELVRLALPHSGAAVRVGITGVPGAGKSTFIEALGVHLCETGKKVAVLAVDPSSTISKGSILGDKTRMETLVRADSAFIRPSPAGETLGGVARRTREAMLLVEAAGYDVVIVETVGTGQSEVTVRSMVDCFLVLMLTGAGDELQGMKKGVIEVADALIVNKADGDNKPRAQAACGELKRILSLLHPATEGWKPRVLAVSALHREGMDSVWRMISDFRRTTGKSGFHEFRRHQQDISWLHRLLDDELRSRFLHRPEVRTKLAQLEAGVAGGRTTAWDAVRELLAL